MSSPAADAATPGRAWIVLLARAVVALVVALVVTFSADHATAVGALAFGLFAIVSGLVIGVGAVTGPLPVAGIVQGAVSGVAGVVSILVARDEIAILLFVLSSWAALTAFIELFRGLRSRGRSSLAREWVFAGALTGLFAIAVLLVPVDLNQVFVGPDEVKRALTASVMVTGLVGAYAAILGVYLFIAALSLRWSRASTVEVAS
ncbi:hypothetical protein QT381_04800 [Galbitalea sp. SE-J8]|uniref:hypothetical protein n=1 Tax=Galbitalea sp. SE-J8 TaxID=3054952 RepID=UPI00259D16CB|nr:hypothetical protein [Galbitalea sp. SE-J8]MDM4762323.1 hypothetical protein [Galbitalea sp. SE-J8]